MEKLLALLFVLAVSFAASLGNFWFTYGIWPLSWTSFFVFALISGVLSHVLSTLIRGEKD